MINGLDNLNVGKAAGAGMQPARPSGPYAALRGRRLPAGKNRARFRAMLQAASRLSSSAPMVAMTSRVPCWYIIW